MKFARIAAVALTLVIALVFAPRAFASHRHTYAHHKMHNAHMKMHHRHTYAHHKMRHPRVRVHHSPIHHM